MIVLAYARKYEPQHLVDELLENMAWVDGVVCLDQRDRVDELWSVRAERVAELRRLAVEAGGEWCLIVDPDERFQDGAEPIIRAAIASHPPATRFSFPLRELWTPTKYRCDGVWGRKVRRRLFHLHEDSDEVERVLLDAELMHLKMIEPANRRWRAKVHAQANTWDNLRRGFDYLTDRTGLRLTDARPYSPPYEPYRFRVPSRLLDR